MSLKPYLSLLLLVTVLINDGCSKKPKVLSGYIEGEYTYVASGVSGTLYHLYAKRGQIVAAQDLLYELDPEPEQSNVAAAKANIGNLQSQVDFAKIQLERQKKLYGSHVTSQYDLDAAQSSFDSKTQQLIASKAALVESEWALAQKKVGAPISGMLFDVFYREGEMIEAAHPVVAILAPKNVKAIFYVAEKDLSTIQVGQTLSFTCDTCREEMPAQIEYISPEAEFTPPVIYSKDTRDNLVYLARAAIPEAIAKTLHPGQPIDVMIMQ